MAQDALLTLADDQPIATTAATGYVVSEHTINLGASHDAFNGLQMFAVLTVKTSFTAAAATSSFQFQIKAATAAPVVFGSLAAQELTPTIAQSPRFLVGDLQKGSRIVVPLGPFTNEFGTGVFALFRPEGVPVIYAFLRTQDAALSPVDFTGGTFDLEIRTENPAGQKYYPQTNSVG
ncbi:MAG: hypothetical protein RIT25_2471 [Planctomycetota bacterium]|jgi:hypothetical protein